MIGACPFKMPTAAAAVPTLDTLLYFTWEREAIRFARQNELPRERWTADPVLARYKFTNIRRRDDRVSQWVIRELIEPAVVNGDEHLWFTLLIARLVNWPPTLERLLRAGVIPCAPERFDAQAFVQVLEGAKAEGRKVYSGAYMLYPTKMDPGGSKSQAVARHIIGDAVLRAEDIRFAIWVAGGGYSVEAVVNALARCFGISTFMAGQVAADLTYTGLPFEDLYRWAPMGPGSLRGLNYLHNRSPFAGWTQPDFNAALMAVNEHIQRELQIADLTLHDVQNVMCEYSKYCRAALGEGKPKTIYQPEKEF